MNFYRKSVTGLACIGLFGLALGISADASAKARFGTYCQQEFEKRDGKRWLDTREEAWNHCGRFNDELDDTDTKVFYWNLHGAKPYLEKSKDQVYIETVNLLYIATHGSATDTDARWCMWDWYTRALSSDMRLGDESYGLSILASWACKTHKKSDGKLITRLRSLFRGGLKYSVGSHGTLHHGRDTNECGEEFADNLQDKDKIKYAWKDALREPFTENDAIAVATGETESECHDRRDNMKWQNYASDFRRLRDGENVWYCWTYWNNL